MATVQDLYEIFESFCSFGSTRNLATGSNDMLNGVTMDNQKFSKFAKDCKIVDGKKITTTDCDILFNKVKAKGARRLDFEGFQTAFQQLADKKYPGRNPKEAYDTLLNHIVDKGPIARGTITEANGVYDKLTNTNLYTGSHKERFDESGVGKGAAGRQMIDSTTANLSQLVNRNTNSNVPNNTYCGTPVAAKKRGTTAIVTASTESLEIKAQPKLKKADVHNSNSSLKSSNTSLATKSTTNVSKSNSSLNKPTTSTKTFTTSKPSGSVFDRLTDVKGYTGAHKERFNSDGTGKGISGRTYNNEGGKQLSSMVSRS
ncbi:Tubulin polymerization-promoting protein member 3 [Clydaea vesicula]|uniref:Tubulin polymerization-promoting protein member 3 n=1 Tax=Clydaea vesicula TaxID=447962 RepID=A0AAD5U3X8_9FUNG|nr:Tubulin polymerization-promoting protein member 3 [Clydaea vesicula]KAJ3395599.1 Tubulin polymerization-promoting protein member 3 [Lobulomyces angularis]